jgi:cystathionine gamma-synthase
MDEMLALQHEGLDAALATLMIHSDDSLRTGPSVASDMSLSTTFRHPTPPADQSDAEFDPSRHVYSRYSQPTLARAEKLLSTLLGGPAMLFSSGLGVGRLAWAILS